MVYTEMRKPDTSWPAENIITAAKQNSHDASLCSNLEIRGEDSIPKASDEQFFEYYKSVFNTNQEEELVNYIKKMNEIFFGLSQEDICHLACKFAESKRIQHPFKNKNAEDHWYSSFVKRHPELIWKLTEDTESEKLDKLLIEHFFTKLRSVLKKYKFPLSHVYAAGELCIKQTENKTPHIVSAEHARQSLSSNYVQNDTFITTVFCCSAIGNLIPPAIILPEKNDVKLLCDSACFKSSYGCNTADIFLKWLKFFIETIRPSENKKVLLILENHCWYKSTEIFDYAAIHNVVIFSLPKPCCNELHPLCLSVFESFKHNFHEIIETWCKNHVLENLNYNLNQIFLEAYLKSVKLQNAIKGFEKSEILKCHQDVSKEVACLPESSDQSDGSSFLEDNFSLIKREKFNFIWNDLQKKAEARRSRKVKLPFMPYSLKNRKYKVKNNANKNSTKKYNNVNFKSSIQTRRGKLSCANVKKFDSPKSKSKPYDEIKHENDESVIQVVYELEIDF